MARYFMIPLLLGGCLVPDPVVEGVIATFGRGRST